VFVRLISPQAPARGQLRLDIAEPGSPAFLELAAWVPDGSILFGDSFE
jgi:hypothetical protein